MVLSYRQPRKAGLSVQQRLKQLGLLHYWPLDEASGDALDYFYGGGSGPINLTDTNSVTQAAGPSNNIPLARSFAAASSQRLTTSSSSQSLNMGIRFRGFSAQVWIYAATLPGTIMGVIGKDDGTTGRNWKISIDASNRVVFTYYNTSNVLLAGQITAAISATTWYHVVAQADNRYVYLWLNGVPIDPAAVGQTDWNNTTSRLDIGNDYSAAGRFFNGRIAQALTASRKWSRDEILWLYNAGQGRDLRRGI